MNQPGQVVRFARMLPQEPVAADTLMLRLARCSVGDDEHRFVVARESGTQLYCVDAGEGVGQPVARELVVAALDQLSSEWRDHLVLMDPEGAK